MVCSSVAVETLWYKAEGCGFETRRAKLFFFSIYLVLLAALGSWFHWASKRNEYQKQKKSFGRVERGRCPGLKTYRHLWADCLNNVESSTFHQSPLQGYLCIFLHFTCEYFIAIMRTMSGNWWFINSLASSMLYGGNLQEVQIRQLNTTQIYVDAVPCVSALIVTFHNYLRWPVRTRSRNPRIRP
jgi:hypothetical protein